METLFELTFQDQTLNPQIGTFTNASQTMGTFTLEDGEYYLTNADTKGFYAYRPVAMQSGLVDDSKVIIEFDLKVVTASVNTHTIIGTYAGVDGSGIPTGAKITLQYNAGDIELVLGGGATATLIESADVVVDQWYHFRIDCTLAASLASTYQVKIDGASVTTVTGATTDYELGIISVLGTDLHACDECGIKNITLVTETNMYVGRTALDQVLQDVKGYVDTTKIPLSGSNQISGSLIPATDNSIDIGSSTKNIKMLYTKGITINGTQFLPSDYATLSGLATVATSGSYNDLSNKPTIPTVNNATLTIQKNGTTVKTFTANASSNVTANITVPTKTSDLTNDSGFITSDNTKIPLVGSNQISGDLIPNTDGTVNLGSPSYQWNNLYAKNYYYNGVAWGLDKANVWTAQQIIVGNNSRGVISIYNPTYTKGDALSVTDLSIGSIYMGDKGRTGLANSLGFVSVDIGSSGTSTLLSLSAMENTTSSTNRANLVVAYDKNDAENPRKVTIQGTVLPHPSAPFSLGTPTNKWKTLNGINPGALSLPGTSVNIDTTNWVLDGSNVNIFTPVSNGWLGIQVIDTVYDQMHYVFVGRASDGNTYYQQNIISSINALWDSKYHGCVFIPVIKNVRYDIRCICSSIIATFYPCQGNV